MSGVCRHYTKQTGRKKLGENDFLKLINNLSRENKENHNCDRGLDM